MAAGPASAPAVSTWPSGLAARKLTWHSSRRSARPRTTPSLYSCPMCTVLPTPRPSLPQYRYPSVQRPVAMALSGLWIRHIFSDPPTPALKNDTDSDSYSVGLEEDPDCLDCDDGVPEDATHLLTSCPAGALVRHRVFGRCDPTLKEALTDADWVLEYLRCLGRL